MYSTAKDVHIAIQAGLNQIDSNRKRTFRPEELDAAFNQAMFKFIEERSVIKPTPDGLGETVKRVDDLRDLTVVDKSCTVYTEATTNRQFLYLPVDYYKFQDLKLSTSYDCNARNIEYLDYPLILNILPFNPANVNDFSTFEIKLSSGTSLYKSSDFKLDTLKNINSKFMIVNSVLENIPIRRSTALKPIYDIYWESFGGFKYDNCFILITPFNNPDYFEIIYGSTTEKSAVFEVNTKLPNLDNSEYEYKPTEILNVKYKNDVLDNYYYAKNRHKKPYIYFSYNDIIIQNIKNTVFNNGLLTYIKKPILLNLRANSMTDFKSHIQEIIDMTITNLSLTLLGSAEANAAISNNNKQ